METQAKEFNDGMKTYRLNFSKINYAVLVATLLILTAFMASGARVHASPFLVCDPPADNDVESAQLEVDGVWDAAIPIPGCTTKQVGCVWTNPANNSQHLILKDLSGIADGAHTVRARFTNLWGDGAPSDPFVFTKAPPGAAPIRLIR